MVDSIFTSVLVLFLVVTFHMKFLEYDCVEMKNQAVFDLEAMLCQESGWIKVHVAEFLLKEQLLAEKVKAEFFREEQRFGETPKYRIGIWRVRTV